MSLDTTDIEAIVDHLGDKMQFYNATGHWDNAHVMDLIRTALESYVGTLSAKSAERFKLVEIAFGKALDTTANADGTAPEMDRDDVAKAIMADVDSMLAAMEKPGDAGLFAVAQCIKRLEDELAAKRKLYAERPAMAEKTQTYRDGTENGLVHALQCIVAMEKTPDTGPSTDEIERRARARAGKLLTDMEVSLRPALAGLRDKIQTDFDADLKANAANPTTNIRLSGYRDGSNSRSVGILAMIDAAIEKAGEPEKPNAK